MVERITAEALQNKLYNYPELFMEYVKNLTEYKVKILFNRHWRFVAILATRKNKWQNFAIDFARKEAKRIWPLMDGELFPEQKLEKTRWMAMLPPIEWMTGEHYEFDDYDLSEEGKWMQMVVCWAIEHGNYPEISDEDIRGNRIFWKDIAKIAVYASCPNVIRKLLCKAVTGNEVLHFICSPRA